MLRSIKRLSPVSVNIARAYSSADPRQKFLQEYKVRSSLERLIHHYASEPLTKLSILTILEQSEKLNSTYILQSARETIEMLLAYNARRLRHFRDLPYLVMLNPSISESYNTYLKTMSVLLTASLHPPCTMEETQKLRSDVLQSFMDVHADALPTLSKGFSEVLHLLSVDKVKTFLDEHLRERVSMRLIAHQQISLTDSFANGTYEEGSPYNGIVKPLNIREVIKRNAELVNDICLMKYDQSVKVKIDTNLHPPNFWTLKDEPDISKNSEEPIIFPYIEYHLDYILMELFKNSFRAHIENHVSDPVQVTVSTSDSPSYMEMRIRDKGKGIVPQALNHVFDYSFSTYESGEGDSYKTLNVPPGEAGNTVAGMGYGLPLLKNYIEIFNDTLDGGAQEPEKGLLSVQSYYGWGTDVYLKTVGS